MPIVYSDKRYLWLSGMVQRVYSSEGLLRSNIIDMTPNDSQVEVYRSCSVTFQNRQLIFGGYNRIGS